MAVSLKHTTQATGTDAGTGEIRKTQWNEEHTLSLAAGKVLGRQAGAGTGAAQELSISVDGSGNVSATGYVESGVGFKFPNGQTQTAPGATTGKAIAMAIVFGG